MMTGKVGSFSLSLLLMFLILPLRGTAQSPPLGPHRALIAWDAGARGADSLDQLSLEAIFGCVGLRPDRIRPDEISRVTPDSGVVLIVPHSTAARISESQSRDLVAGVERGMVLVTDGMSGLSGLLGIRLGEPRVIGEVTDHMRPALRLTWPRPQAERCIEESPAGSTVVYSDRRRDRPLAIILRRGQGACLYIAPLVDPHTDKGYSRFATLPTVIIEGLGCRPLLSRRSADAYFDPGYRFGRPAEELARMWKSWGVTGIHVAAWYASSTPPFDYAGLINALHRNGIRVYAWLEWPYIGKGFWDKHPSWRQKNALLKDAHLDFLYLMDLQNPACMSAALGELEVLLDLDWDGVDVAEFTLTGAGREALEGPAMPEFFTGFTETGRREFSKQFGFDPLELFNPVSRHYWKADTTALKTFYRYRTGVNYSTERQLFSNLKERDRERKRPREMMLTIVDNASHPEFDELLGFDMKETLAIANQFELAVNVEDPYMEWSKPPDRYTQVGAYYRRLLGGAEFMIDVNVVPLPADRKPYFPTAQAAGTEFLELWKYAAGGTGRVCFYCESSVYEKDWELLPFAMAGDARLEGGPDSCTVETPYTVILRNTHEKGGVTLDGEPWPAEGDSLVIVPAGKHSVRVSRSALNESGIRLLSLSGELKGARGSGDSISVRYNSAGRCALEFDVATGSLVLDGRPALLSLYRSEGGCVVLAPPGNHTLTIRHR